jgi:hypothetical protein
MCQDFDSAAAEARGWQAVAALTTILSSSRAVKIGKWSVDPVAPSLCLPACRRYVCLHYTLKCDGECIKCVVLDGERAERGCGGAAGACTLRSFPTRKERVKLGE